MSETSPSYPIVFSIVFFLGGIAFFISIYVIEILIGSPSSTSALLFIYVLPYALAIGLAGGAIGLVTDVVIRRVRRGEPLSRPSRNRIFVILSIAILGLSIVIPLIVQLKWNAYNSPGVKVDRGLFSKTPFDARVIRAQDPTGDFGRVLDFSARDRGKKFVWNGEEFIVKFDEHAFEILDSLGSPFIYQSLKGYDYIREVTCLPVGKPLSQVVFLAVFADLRATSRNSILHFFSPDGQCVYQELMRNVRTVLVGSDLSSGNTVVLTERRISQSTSAIDVYKQNESLKVDSLGK